MKERPERPLAEVIPIGQEKRMRELESRGYIRRDIARGTKDGLDKTIAAVGIQYPVLTEFFFQQLPDGKMGLLALIPPPEGVEPGGII